MVGERFPIRRASRERVAAAILLAPAAATGLAYLLHREGTTTAVSLYLLAVVVAAIVGGLLGGLGAAVVSAIGLNYIFTPPRFTLRIGRSEDVIAFAVFAVVAVVVQSLVARVVAERERATRREQETRLLNELATKALSGQPIQTTLKELAEALLSPFRLERAEIRARLAGREELEVVAPAVPPGPSEPELDLPLVAPTGDAGSLAVVTRPDAEPIGDADRRWLEACARVIAIAVERARLDAEIDAARVESETSELRAALFSSVTHDLRTPLATIKAGVTSLLDPELPPDPERQRELLTTALEETDRLNRLVGNLLDLARVRAGALEPARQPTHLEDVLEAVLHRMRSGLRGFELRTIVRPDVPEVPIDPVQIDQVFTNLLENASRFSPPGGEILVSMATKGDAAQVRIADHGPGIPASERLRVFEAFYRRDTGRGRGGSGLGLAIAKAIVVAHGGRIWVEDAPGGGTAIVFEVPLDAERGPERTELPDQTGTEGSV